VPGIVVGAALACALFWVQLRTLYVTQTASYDTLLYARSLWAMFSSDGFNPVYGTHWLGIHANLLMYPLATFARLVEPATLLAGQHAAAMGVTVVLVDRSLRSHGAPHHLAKALAMTALSILFVGAFTFDPRPASAAVPIGFALLDRLDQRRQWDVVSALLAAALVLTREEFGVVLAGAVFVPGLNATGRRQSGLAAALGFAWFCGYWFGVRPAVDSAFASGRANAAASDLFGLGDAQTLIYRGAVIGALATMGGAALVRAPRWVLVAAPGIVWLLAIDKGGVDALRYHYPMLALPALLAAAVHVDRSGVRGARAGWAVTGVQALGLLWLLPRVAMGFWIVSVPEQAALSAARALLATVPADAGLAAPYMISAGEADREFIYSEETMVAALRSDSGLPDTIDVVALSPSGQSIARFLVGRAGFRLAAPPSALILLERGPDQSLVSPSLLELAEPAECAHPAADFSEQGVRICAVQRDETSGRLRLLVHRYAAPGMSRWTWMAVSPEIQSPISVMAGLVLPSQLPAETWVWAMSDQPWMTSSQPQFQLVFADGSGDSRR
jgi:hypothetical protein